MMKSIIWHGSSYEDTKAFPPEARRDAGFQLGKVQRGMEPDDWKPLVIIGSGVREIRIRESSGAFRIIYAANIGGCIHVLHAFQKKTQKTRQSDLAIATARYRAIVR
jgi:phage-related protein